MSIVSHSQGLLVQSLLKDLNNLVDKNFKVVLTINCPEDESFLKGLDLDIFVISNTSSKGFGANHNEAFRAFPSQWFIVVNPDIRITELDFSKLLGPFRKNSVMIVAPRIVSLEGKIEDSGRRYPTFLRLFKRFILRQYKSDYPCGDYLVRVDWVAGMFVVFRAEAFSSVGGFDDKRFYMYMEDADICRRITQIGGEVLINPATQVIHIARRASRRNLRHMRWHAVSAFRFLTGL